MIDAQAQRQLAQEIYQFAQPWSNLWKKEREKKKGKNISEVK